MKIKLIDFGVPEHQRPYRPHGNDAGADVYLPYDCTLQPGEIAKIPLGFGLEIPDGYAGYIFPCTSMAVKGLVCELPPVDSGYRGEIHAIISNVSNQAQSLFKGARIGQVALVRDGANTAVSALPSPVVTTATTSPLAYQSVRLPLASSWRSCV